MIKIMSLHDRNYLSADVYFILPGKYVALSWFFELCINVCKTSLLVLFLKNILPKQARTQGGFRWVHLNPPLKLMIFIVCMLLKCLYIYCKSRNYNDCFNLTNITIGAGSL